MERERRKKSRSRKEKQRRKRGTYLVCGEGKKRRNTLALHGKRKKGDDSLHCVGRYVFRFTPHKFSIRYFLTFIAKR